MKTFNEGFGGGDSEPSRRDVVKYGAAAAIAVTGHGGDRRQHGFGLRL
jgi:hypothetical protein